MSSEPPQVERTLLILSVKGLEGLLDPTYLKPAVTDAARRTKGHLRIIVFSALFNSESGIAPVHYWKEVQTFITGLYAEATRVAKERDNILFNVEVLLGDLEPEEGERHRDVSWDQVVVFNASSPEESAVLSGFRYSDSTPTSIPLSYPPSTSIPIRREPGKPQTYPVIALGGTFDHLHAGHKILLSMSAWIATRKVIVGMTDDTLLVKKANRHLLEPLSVRVERTRSFLNLFKPGLEYYLPTLTDVYGPTAYDSDIQALVVSKETLNGAAAIAKHRKEHSLPALETFVIDVISPDASVMDTEDAAHLREAKMGSTFIRQWIANKQKEASGENLIASPQPVTKASVKASRSEVGAAPVPGAWIEDM